MNTLKTYVSSAWVDAVSIKAWRKVSYVLGIAFALFSITALALTKTTGNNFTMLDSTGALVGGTNDVTFTWDETYKSSVAASGQVSNATLSSPTTFFGSIWTAHDIAIYAPGTYTIYTGCAPGAPGCGVGTPYTMTVGADQVGTHMLFDWGGNLNIDVIVVWNRNAAFGPSPMWTGAGGANPATKVWDLMSADTNQDPDAFNGTKMIDGPFTGFSANFNLMATIPAAGSISSTTPASAATDVAITSPVTMTFSRPMNAASVAGAFTLVGPGSTPVAGTMSPNTGMTATVFTFTPTSPLSYQTTYTATLNATARDASGLALVAGATNPWSFTTELAPVAAGSLTCIAATPGSFNGVFTMLDSQGGRVGRDLGVTGTWDGTVNTASNGTNFNMTLASPNPFFGATWTTHDIRVFGPGTYSINTGCTTAELRAGTPPAACAVAGETMTFTVGSNQLGAHMLFDWSGNNNISVVNVWNRNTRSSCTPSAVPLKASDGPAIGYGLAMIDVNGDGISGLPMATTSPFPRFNANFDLYPGAAGAPTLATLPDAGSAGGGCTLSRNAAFDPVMPALVALVVGWMGIRRYRARVV